MLSAFMNRIRRRESPFYDQLYITAKRIRGLNVPPVRVIYVPLRGERALRHALWGRLSRLLYHEPMFRTRCARCGPGLCLIGGQPQIYGNLRLELGREVTMHGVTTFMAGKVVDEPVLKIGDYSHLGYQVEIAVGSVVEIGSHVLIANRVAIMGYDFHPLDPVKRRCNEPPGPEGAGPVHIGDDAWIGSHTLILKGVTIGTAAVIGAGSLVTHDIPPYTVAAGRPARVIRHVSGPYGRDVADVGGEAVAGTVAGGD